jgi:hypothetical protein
MIRVEESSRQTVVRSEQRDVAIRSTHGDHKAIVDDVVLSLSLSLSLSPPRRLP